MLHNIEDFTANLKRRQFLQNETEWHIPSCFEGHFLGIRRGVELHQEEVFLLRLQTFFCFCHVFLRFLTFLKFLFERCLHLWWLKRRDLRSFGIRFEFESAVPIRFDSDGPIRKFSNRPCLPIARSSQTSQTINDA